MPDYGYDLLYDTYFAVKNDGMSVCRAALEFGVPKSTLWDRVNGKVDLGKMSKGPDPLFSQQEEYYLTNHIEMMAGKENFCYLCLCYLCPFIGCVSLIIIEFFTLV